MTLVALALSRVRVHDAALTDLDERERAALLPGAVPKRRAEYAAGRRAARAALARFLGQAAEGTAVVPAGAGGGKPLVIDASGAPLADAHLSITHAAGLAAAAVAPRPIGLDLVTLEPLEEAFREEAFEPGEIARWEAWIGAAQGSVQGPCVAFAAKEAVLKWLGTGLELPLRAVRVEPAGPGTPTLLGDAVAALSMPVRVESPRGTALLEGWIAASPRRVMVGVCGSTP
ncbi:MAG: 4'-phosphopantetheinyl transferase superfamily protein [Anaeromyxobacter sp.]